MTDSERTVWAEKQKKFIVDFANGCDPTDDEGRLKLHYVWFAINEEAMRTTERTDESC